MDKFAVLTVDIPVSQYVRVEAAAAEGGRSPEDVASFLLSEWVLTTQRRATTKNPNRRRRCAVRAEGGR